MYKYKDICKMKKNSVFSEVFGKKFIGFCFCLVVLYVLSGCNSQNNQNNPSEPKTLKGTVSRPTWTAPADYDYSSSMTAIIRVDLRSQFTAATDFAVSDQDVLAAFSGENCLGIAGLSEGLFFIYICAPVEDEAEQNITLRYWSAGYTNMFEAVNVFTYVNDSHQGTISEPIVPTWVIKK